MATLDIAGKQVEVGDEFLKLSPEDQNKTVEEIAKSIGQVIPPAVAERAKSYDPNDPRFSDMSAHKALEGVPLLGAYVPQAGAAISAAAQPLTGVGSKGDTWWDRYKANLGQEQAASKAADEEHPIASAVAGGIGGTLALGGVGGAFPAVAKAMGMTGPWLGAMRNAATSGALIGGADTAARGGDVGSGATMGALTGLGGIVAGKGIGKGIDAVRGALRPTPAPTPIRTIDVNGRPVPVSEGRATSDPALQAEEEIYRQGNKGKQAQDIALAHDEARKAGMTGAHEDFSAGLDPTTPPVPGAGLVTPQDAATTVAADLAEKELGRQAGRDVVRAQVLTQGQELRSGLSPTNEVVADTPYTVAAGISQSVREAAQRAAQARTAAYEAARQVPGEFEPAAFNRIGASIRNRLNTGDDRVIVTDQKTPNAAEALRYLDENLGRVPNQAEPPRPLGPDGRPAGEPPITGETVDEVRKYLVSLQRDASQAAARTNDFTDRRAMQRVLQAFEDHVREAATGGAFSGDGPALLAALDRARGLHAQYRQTFSPQNPQDEAGKAMEAMIGKYPGTAADPDKAATHLFGSQAEPGGQGPNRTAARILQIFGPQSPEWAAYRQGLLAHTVETPAGMDALPHAKVASRIERLMLGGKGQSLARTAFTEPERNAALAHARNLRTLEEPKPTSPVDKILHNWAGRDGGPPASASDVVRYLTNTSSADKATTTNLIRRLKTELPESSFNKIKQGMFTSVVQPAEGVTEWGDRKIATSLAEFLNGKGKFLAEELFTARERELMENIRKAHELMAPLPGTTNPSGSAHMGARILAGARHSLLPMLGFAGYHAGGLPGTAVALAADQAVKSVVNSRNATKAMGRFFGPQPPATSTPPPAAQALGAVVVPALQQRQSRQR